MKTIFVLLILTTSFQALIGQNVYLGLGKTIANLEFKDTEGNQLEGLEGSSENYYCLGARYPLFGTKFHVSGDVSYQQYISKGSNPELGSYYEWDASFAGLNLNFDYEFFKPNFAFFKKQAFSFCAKGSIASEFLINGTQNSNNQLVDLKDAPEYENPFVYLRGGLCGNYYFSKEIYVYVQYMGGKSLSLGDYTNKQQVSYITHCISVGVSYNLTFMNTYRK